MENDSPPSERLYILAADLRALDAALAVLRLIAPGANPAIDRDRFEEACVLLDYLRQEVYKAWEEATAGCSHTWRRRPRKSSS